MDIENGETSHEYNGWVVAIMMLLSAITVTGNVATIVIILAKKNLRCNPSNRFILSLSFADCFVGLFVMFPSALRIMKGGWFWNLSSCKMFITADITFCSASIYSLIGISLDRCYAVFYPFEYATKRKMSTIELLISLAWVMALVISLPMYIDSPGFSNFANIMNETTILDNNLGGCMPPVDPDSVGFVLYSGCLAFVIPFIVLGALQAAILYRRRAIQGRKLRRADASVRLEREASRLTSATEQSFSSATPGEKSAKRKISIAISQEESVPELHRKISTVSFKDVPEAIAIDEVKMRNTSYEDANVRLTTGSSLSSSLSTDEDSIGCQEFNEAEIKEIKENKEILKDLFSKSRRQLTKTEKKLKREHAMQRK